MLSGDTHGKLDTLRCNRFDNSGCFSSTPRENVQSGVRRIGKLEKVLGKLYELTDA